MAQWQSLLRFRTTFSKPRRGDFQLARDAGFIGCLSKPVLPSALNEVLNAMQR
jgi:hypothetical protein